jgi:3D (Asp-Asp-Asp) domain-containing protein
MRIWVMGSILSILLITPIVPVYAQTNIQNENQNEIFSEKYDFSDDPFLLEWSFGAIPMEDQSLLTEEPVNEETIVLSRWKEKQAEKWENLPKEKFLVNASAYTAAADECGKSNGITSSGLRVEENRTLACPPSFPFGAKIYIDGVGERRCEDRGGAIKGNHVDIYMQTKGEAFAFGRKTLEAYVVE